MAQWKWKTCTLIGPKSSSVVSVESVLSQAGPKTFQSLYWLPGNSRRAAMSHHSTRRDFLRHTAVAAAAGGYLATAKGYAQNETITIGAIGTGGRCRQLLEVVKQ